jgi:hypothetical protein
MTAAARREERSAKLLLAGVIGLTLANSGVSVAFSYIGRDFWTALSQKDPEQFAIMLQRFGGALVAGVPVTVFYRQARRRQRAMLNVQHDASSGGDVAVAIECLCRRWRLPQRAVAHHAPQPVVYGSADKILFFVIVEMMRHQARLCLSSAPVAVSARSTAIASFCATDRSQPAAATAVTAQSMRASDNFSAWPVTSAAAGISARSWRWRGASG